MDGRRTGRALRAVRHRLRWRQTDVAARAGVSHAMVSRAERGAIDEMSIRALDRIAEALGITLDLVPRWRGGELDRLLNADHSALLEAVTRQLERLSGWLPVPEVTFSIYGERGSIDVLARHGDTRNLLVIELKTAIVDVQELLMTLDRKRRLARQIARDRGWNAASVSVWLVVSDTATNRRRVDGHAAALRSALPASGPDVRRWLHAPHRAVAALSFHSSARQASTRSSRRGIQRVRRPASTAVVRGEPVPNA